MIDQDQARTDSIVPDHVEAPIDDPTFHLDVLDELTHSSSVTGAVPLASYPDNRYPYAYPRDIASITRAWLLALKQDVRPDRCCDRIVETARFFVAVADDGRWYQRYALDGTDKSIYRQEDNIAHGLRILSHAVVALDERNRLESTPDEFVAEIVECLDSAVATIRSELYDANAHLLESTTSIHEGAIESGYTLWVNSAAVAALDQAGMALDQIAAGDGYSVESTFRERVIEFHDLLAKGLARSFAVDGMPVPRRYTPDGKRDERPDVTLLAPAYFGLEDIFGDQAIRTVDRAADALKDPQLGGLQRFHGFYHDHDVHQHGGNGPWFQYTAWHAQFRYDQGARDAGDTVLSTITDHATAEGHIPEHLSTADRFEQFRDREWDTEVDYRKEFDDEVLRDVPFDRIVQELDHMRQAYDKIAAALEDDDVVSFAEPLTWSHAEFLAALLKRPQRP